MAEAKLKARAEMDTTKFDSGLDKMQRGVKTFSSTGLKGVAEEIGKAFAVERIASWGMAQLQAADALVTLSENIGLSTDALQALYSIGRNSNLGVEEIDKAMGKLALAQDKVINQDKNMIEAFERLGISAEQVASSSMQELFESILAGAATSATAINDMTDIFGKGMGVKLQPLIGETFQSMIDKAKELGEVVSAIDLKDMANAADDIEHAFKQAGTWLVDKLMYAVNLVKNIAAIFGAVSGGSSFGDAIDAAARGEIGAGRAAIEKKFADEKAANALAQEQKLAQQKANIKKAADEKYEKELTKMLEDAEKDRASNEKKINAEAAKKKLDALKDAQKAKWREEDRDEAIAKLKAEKRADISVGSPQSADSMARIGLFSGGQINNAPRMIMERQLKVAEDMKTIQNKILDIQRDYAKDVKRTAEAVTGG
jgi:hypothetical protein